MSALRFRAILPAGLGVAALVLTASVLAFQTDAPSLESKPVTQASEQQLPAPDVSHSRKSPALRSPVSLPPVADRVVVLAEPTPAKPVESPLPVLPEPRPAASAEPAASMLDADKSILGAPLKPGTHDTRLTVDELLPIRVQKLDLTANALVPAGFAQVTLTKAGAIVKRGEPGVDGVVQLRQIAPGLYSLFGAGSEGFLAFSIRVHPGPGNVGDGGESALAANLVPPADVPSVKELIRRHLPTGAAVTPEPWTEVLPRGAPVPAPSEARAIPQLAGELRRAKPFLELDADGKASGYFVRLDQDNWRPMVLTDLKVYFIRDGQIVTETKVRNADGYFEVLDLNPGFYSMVAAGVDGFAALTVAVCRADVTARQETNTEPRVQPVSLVRGAEDEPEDLFRVILVSPEDFAFLRDFAGMEVLPGGGIGLLEGPLPPGMAGLAESPYYDGFMGGGGAGGGGGFGLGEILGGLGLAAGLAALLQDDDGQIVITERRPPASPAQTEELP